ncbi:MAG TPA: choice-of-anchor D domain-containing protein [Terriglobales bacterium]|nr:choice-of-anchor D domain-containing protein [Terriglobales bacterium]
MSVQNSATLVANFPASITCPAGHGVGGTGTGGLVNGACRKASYPVLYNDVFWQNRSFYIGVGPLGTGTLNQQHVVSLFNAGGSPVASQTATGTCPAGASYWDIGERGATGPTNHASTVTLSREASILTSTAGYTGGGAGFRVNSASNPAVVSQYCNGSRVPPEFGGLGYQVPPGIADATVPNPIFALTPSATVDEGNNWINISWGPLAETNPVTNATLGNYALTAGSPAINYINPANSATTYAAAPSLDFFGNARKTNNAVDVGAVEFVAGPPRQHSVCRRPPWHSGTCRPAQPARTQNLTLSNTGTAGATGIALTLTGPFTRVTTGTFPTGAPNCGTTLAAAANCTIKVAFAPTATGAAIGSAAIAASVTVAGSPVTLTGTGVAQVVSANLTPTTRNFGTVARGRLLGPVQIFTLTNTGNVSLTGITQGALGGTNPTEFTIIRLLSTCGPAGGGQLLGQTTLTPGAACTVAGQFRPLTSKTTGVKNATVSVTDAAGTQSSTLAGTANP